MPGRRRQLAETARCFLVCVCFAGIVGLNYYYETGLQMVPKQ